ncbi:MAG: hypothetical protein EOO77_02910 [Oxalobacteraceae bacterium]|nr:MAG: hypothetical protein EOO77_02910 [Oxalobacteraceae bacterium]
MRHRAKVGDDRSRSTNAWKGERHGTMPNAAIVAQFGESTSELRRRMMASRDEATMYYTNVFPVTDNGLHLWRQGNNH